MLFRPLRALLFLLATLTVPAHAGVIDIDNAELARLMASGVPVIDIRTEGEWKETGVIPGSRLITLFDERGRANPPVWLERVKGVVDPERPLIVICRSGNRTQAASRFLVEQAGYKTVYNVRRGIRAWTAEGRPLFPPTTSLATCPAGTRC